MLSAITLTAGTLDIDLAATEHDLTIFGNETADTLIIQVDGTTVSSFPIAQVQVIDITANDLDNTVDLSGIPLGSVQYTTVNLGAGNDRFVGSMSRDLVLAGDGNDTILGGGQPDSADGGGGDDILIGSAGNDSMGGGAGNDSLFGQAGSDSLMGGAGTDSMDPGSSNGDILVDDECGCACGEGEALDAFELNEQGESEVIFASGGEDGASTSVVLQEGTGQAAGEAPPTSATLQWPHFKRVAGPELFDAKVYWKQAFSEGPRKISGQPQRKGAEFCVEAEARSTAAKHTAPFDPTSWFVNGKGSIPLLVHERLHLRIAEYIAEKATIRAAALVGKGSASNVNEATAKAAAQKQARDALKTQFDTLSAQRDQIDKAVQAAYDTATRHSADLLAQADWNANWKTEVDKILNEKGW